MSATGQTKRVKPLFSVITVCRNAAGALKTTMASVAGQDFPDMEYIIVDGNSSDASKDIIEAAGNIVSRWISEPDKGIYDAMNKGVKMASGDWVIFMNAGDTFASPDTLSRVAKSMTDIEPTTAVIYGDVIKKVDEKGEIIKKAEPMHNSHRMIFCHQSSFAGRESLLRHPFDISHKFSADFKFFKTLIREGVGYLQLDFPIAVFDTGGISNSRRSDGLADNMRVICETDGMIRGLPHLLHLFPSWLICRLRGK